MTRAALDFQSCHDQNSPAGDGFPSAPSISAHAKKADHISQPDTTPIASPASRHQSGCASTPALEREILWDYARGIGILLVVYGHVLRGLDSADLIPAGHPIMASDYAIYTSHMPLFFLLAGMNVERGLARGGFLRRKLSTIVYPYLLWTLLPSRRRHRCLQQETTRTP